jgi:hypothetical protein
MDTSPQPSDDYFAAVTQLMAGNKRLVTEKDELVVSKDRLRRGNLSDHTREERGDRGIVREMYNCKFSSMRGADPSASRGGAPTGTSKR